MTRLALAALAALALCVFPTGASAATQPVDALFATFSPTPLDVLPGERVEWSNVSQRRHTVTADDGSFDSGDLLAGDRFSHDFAAVGAYEYHCTLHPGMNGEVDVRRVTLGPLPATTVLTGAPVKFEGRTADPARPVTIELDTGTGFRPAGVATPAADGGWHASHRPLPGRRRWGHEPVAAARGKPSQGHHPRDPARLGGTGHPAAALRTDRAVGAPARAVRVVASGTQAPRLRLGRRL